jgi:PAS domain S-box-containing protein
LEEAQRIAHVGYWDRDLDTDLVIWSEETFRIYGLRPQQGVLNMARVLELIHPEDLSMMSRRLAEALQGGLRYDVEYRVIHPGGEVHIVHSQGEIIRDDSGRPRRMFGAAQDVTEARQAEDALRRSHKQYEELVGSVDGIVWEADPRTFQFVFVSQQAERILGYPREEWLRRPDFWVAHLHPEDRNWAAAFCAGAVRENRNHTFEYRMLAADGRVVWLRDIVSVVVEGGEPVALRGMMVDVTDRKRAEQALQESEQRYREVFNSSSECLFLIDVTPDGRFRFAELNPAAERAIGFSTADVAGKFVKDAVPQDVAAAITANYRRCVEAGTMLSYEEDLNLPAGPRSFHSSLIPVRDDAGRIHRLIGIARDITEQKRADEQIRLSLREKEALLKEVHHRVKNNLQLMSSMLSLQAARTRDPGVADLLAESRNRLRSMALVHESLYQLGNFAGIPMASHVPSLCAQLFRSYNTQTQRVELETRVADVVLDLDRAIPCSLIINELVTNALKHAFPDGRSGRISVVLTPEPGGRHKLQVQDDGVGLPADLDPQRADSLGLQLVSDLTEQLHGALRVSRAGGTTFTITFGADGREER